MMLGLFTYAAGSAFAWLSGSLGCLLLVVWSYMTPVTWFAHSCCSFLHTHAPCNTHPGRGYQWSHNWQNLQLIEVQQDSIIDPAAAAAAGVRSSSAGGGCDADAAPLVLMAPLEELEAAAQRDQLPLLIQIDTVPSSCQPTEQQLAAFSDTLQDRYVLHIVCVYVCRCCFSGVFPGWILIRP